MIIPELKWKFHFLFILVERQRTKEVARKVFVCYSDKTIGEIKRECEVWDQLKNYLFNFFVMGG